jgi:hypothetical protein
MGMNTFFLIGLTFPAALGPEVYLASNRNEYQKQKIMFPRSRERPVRKVDNLTAICEPIFNISQSCRPPRLLTGIALLTVVITIF